MLLTRTQHRQPTSDFANAAKRLRDRLHFVQQAWSLSQNIEANFENHPAELKRRVQQLGKKANV